MCFEDVFMHGSSKDWGMADGMYRVMMTMFEDLGARTGTSEGSTFRLTEVTLKMRNSALNLAY